MPVLNIQLNDLAERGPVIQVLISVHPSMAGQLIQRGETLPEPVSGLALLDTGSSHCVIDDGIAQKLHLPP